MTADIASPVPAQQAPSKPAEPARGTAGEAKKAAETSAAVLPDTANVPRFPDFYGIGVQKAGTTWLHEHLRRHPDVWMPRVKELHYFNHLHIPAHRAWTGDLRRRHASRFLKGYVTGKDASEIDFRVVNNLSAIADDMVDDRWYSKIFSAAPPDRVCGEITPAYALLPAAGIAHMLRLNPTARIFLLLRDPIARTWSHANMIARYSPGTTITLEWMEQNIDDMLTRSEYPAVIRRWRARVAERQLFIDTIDSIANRPQELLKSACDFLGVVYRPKYFPGAEKRVYAGKSKSKSIPEDIYAALRTRFEPSYRKMAEDFPDLCGDWLKKHYA